MLRKARIQHAGDVRVRRQFHSQVHRRSGLPVCAQVQRAHAAHQQIGLERTQDAALHLADGLDALPERIFLLCREHTGDHIGMPVQDLGGSVHHHIRTECKRLCVNRRGAGGINGNLCTRLVGDLDCSHDVGDGPERVGGRFQPDQPGFSGPDRCFQLCQIIGFTKRGLKPPALRLGHQPAAQCPVHHTRRDNVIARIKRLKHGRCSRHPA